MSEDVTTNVGTDVLFENEVVRVWRMRLAPGERSDMHVHLHDYALVYADPGHMELKWADRPEPLRAPSDEGFVYYQEVGEHGLTPHQLANVGDTESTHYIFEFLGPSRSRVATEGQSNGRFVEGAPSDL